MKNVLEFIENSAKNFPDKVAFSDETARKSLTIFQTVSR